jgi:hypothetical protein
MDKESWKPIAGYTGLYLISDAGRVKSCTKEAPAGRIRQPKVMRQELSPEGYPTIRLSKGGHKTRHNVHRLVIEAFRGRCPEGMECRHIDGNPANNNIGNLKWGTRSENMQDAVQHGTTHRPFGNARARGEDNGNSKMTARDVLSIRNDSRLHRIIASDYGVTRSTISKIKTRERWRHVA